MKGCRPRRRYRRGANRSGAPARGSAGPKSITSSVALRPPLPPAAAAVQAVDMENADALDLLHRLDALAHDALDPVEQLAPEQRVARAVGQHVLGFVQRASAPRPRPPRARARPPRRCASPRPPSRRCSTSIVVRRRAISLSRTVMTRSCRLGRARLGVLGLRLRRRLFERLLIESDRLLHQRRLDHPSRGRPRACAVRARARCGLRRCRGRRRCGRARPPRARRSRPPATPERARSRAARSRAGVRAARLPAPARARRRSSRLAAWRRSRPAGPDGRRRCARSAWRKAR